MNILKHATVDAADLIVGGAILTGIGVGTAFVVGGAPIIAAGAAISAICAGTTIAVSRVASHVFGGLLHNHPKTARCFKVMAFLSSVGLGVGAAVGAAFLAPTLGVTLGISLTAGAAILGSVALAATVGYVAYLALKGIYSHIENNRLKRAPLYDENAINNQTGGTPSNGEGNVPPPIPELPPHLQNIDFNDDTAPSYPPPPPPQDE